MGERRYFGLVASLCLLVKANSPSENVRSLTSILDPLDVVCIPVAYLPTFQWSNNCSASNSTKFDPGETWVGCRMNTIFNACVHELPRKIRARGRAIEHPIQNSQFQRTTPRGIHRKHCKPGREAIHKIVKDFSIRMNTFLQINTKSHLTLHLVVEQGQP